MSVRSGRRRRVTATVLVAVVTATSLAAAPADAGDESSHVVVMASAADAYAAAARHEVTPDEVFTETVEAFVADLDDVRAAELARDPDVTAVIPDQRFELAIDARPSDGVTAEVQRPSTGLRRVGGLRSRTARIDGVDERVDVDIVVIDSGVDAAHPDLDVVGSIDCAGAGSAGPFDDHGTHVAGIAAAIDDDRGVVGVAPGARVTSVRVADSDGVIELSSLLCATEWVATNARRVDVANLSLAGPLLTEARTRCGRHRGEVIDPLHASICNGVRRGITYVVAGGNQAVDAREVIPASYPQVIAVSAFSDFDGRPGGRSASDCFGLTLPVADDTMAPFSNFGRAIAIAAPGVCIESTIPGGRYGVLDGTSMSAPHVAGAAGLILSRRPERRPEQVRAELLGRGERGPLPGDPDRFPEPLLDVRRL